MVPLSVVGTWTEVTVRGVREFEGSRFRTINDCRMCVLVVVLHVPRPSPNTPVGQVGRRRSSRGVSMGWTRARDVPGRPRCP